ncbi:MAG: ABC transporter ATP-binding protein [Thermoplasmatota archaeon]
MPPFLELRSIHKSFDREKIVRGLDLSVEEGSMMAVLGPSGCGKSTTLRIIAGLLKQDRGSVLVSGSPIDRLPVSRRNMGFVFQNYSLFPTMNVCQNIEFGMRMKRVPKAIRKKRCLELITLSGLEGLENRKPRELSGGQQPRVALARALAIQPELLLLDEPFGALDARIRKRIRRDLKRIQEEVGFTALFVTHDQEEAFEVGDLISVMNRGRIEQVGRPRDLYERPSTDFIARFVGTVNTILLPGKGDDPPLTVMVRPDDVTLHRGPGFRVHGRLMSYTYLGPLIEVSVHLENGDDLTCLMQRERFRLFGFRRGDTVGVRINRFRTFNSERT